MVQRVADGGAGIGQAGYRLARIDDASADGQVFTQEVLAVEHDARRRVGIDGDDVLVGRLGKRERRTSSRHGRHVSQTL